MRGLTDGEKLVNVSYSCHPSNTDQVKKMFDKLVNVMFPIILVICVIQVIVFFGAWILMGRKDPQYQGVIGCVKYYFYTWRKAFSFAKETYFYEEEENTDQETLEC